MSAADAIALYRAEREKRPLPPSEPCPFTKEDARYRWRLKQQRNEQSGWGKYHATASEKLKLSLRIAFTGWVE